MKESDSMQLKNMNGEYIEADIIRYFENDDNEYLIYSLGETDEAGYVRLYASKINDGIANIIADAEEWQSVTQIIKETVRNNRDGNELELTDLNEDRLYDVTLQDTRIFKLQGNLVTLLSENKNVKEETPTFEELTEEVDELDDEIIEETIDFEVMYKDQLEKNMSLQNRINELEEEVNTYKNKINNIKDLLEETIN